MSVTGKSELVEMTMDQAREQMPLETERVLSAIKSMGLLSASEKTMTLQREQESKPMFRVYLWNHGEGDQCYFRVNPGLGFRQPASVIFARHQGEARLFLVSERCNTGLLPHDWSMVKIESWPELTEAEMHFTPDSGLTALKFVDKEDHQTSAVLDNRYREIVDPKGIGVDAITKALGFVWGGLGLRNPPATLHQVNLNALMVAATSQENALDKGLLAKANFIPDFVAGLIRQ